MATKAYRFDYTTYAYGRARASLKTIRAYSWNDAAARIGAHAKKKWAAYEQIKVVIHNASVDGELMNPDLFPEMNRLANA